VSAPDLVPPGTTGGGPPVGGSGTIGTVPKWATTSTLDDSVITELGTNIGIGTASPGYKFEVAGNAYVTTQLGIGTIPVGTRSVATALDCEFNGVRVGRGANTGGNNTAVGDGALNTVAAGLDNTAIGASSLSANTTGNYNTAIGRNALVSNTTGGENSAIGRSALSSNTIGGENIAIGRSALGSNTTGGKNTAFGAYSGGLVTTGSNNISIGYNASHSGIAATNEIVIGVNAAGVGNNTLSIGSSVNFVATNGAAATYFTSATATSSGILPATCGFIKVNLNGTIVKIPIYAD